MSILTHPYRRLLATTFFENTKSVYFDGVSQYMMFNNLSLSDGTLAGWIFVEAGGDRTIFSSTENAASPFTYLRINNSTNILQVAARTGGGAGVIAYVIQATTTPMTAGSWYSYVWTKTGTTHKMYINGLDQTLSFVSSANLSPFVTLTRATLGSFRRNTNTDFFKGNQQHFIASPSIWSQAQVTEFHNSGCPLNMVNHSDFGNLQLWFRMGNSVNDVYPTIEDNIGSNDATMVNMIAANIQTFSPC